MGFIVLIFVILLLWIVYRHFASKYEEKYFNTLTRRPSPARRYMDGQEFIPTPGGVLIISQWMALSLEPVFGAVIAVQFGWLPALLWLVGAAILAGWIQNFSLTMISLRHAGADLGELVGKILSPASRDLLYSILYTYLAIILSSLAVLMAPLISKDNVAIGTLLLVCSGVITGQLLFRQRTGVGIASLIAVLLGLIGVYLGTLPWAQEAVNSINGLGETLGINLFLKNLPGYSPITWPGLFWIVILFAICYFGSILPVWRFALPVNYVAGWYGMLCLVGAISGVVITTYTGTGTPFEIPVFVLKASNRLGPIWPILCVTLTGGAISGWHGLVATFSTSRLLDKAHDARKVSVGAIYLETVLALMAIVFAASLGVSTGRYDPSRDYQLVAGAAGVFVSGMATFLNAIGLPLTLAESLSVILLVLLSITSLQLVARFMRQVSAGWLGGKFPSLRNAHFGTTVALVIAFLMAIFGLWQWLWILFGSLSLLIAGLGLFFAAIWLKQQGIGYRWPFWSGVAVFITGYVAMFYLIGFQAIYRGIIAPEGLSTAARLGNTISASLGVYLIYACSAIFVTGFSKMRTIYLDKYTD